MIKFVEWLLGRTHGVPTRGDVERDRVTAETVDLDQRAAEALRHRAEARKFRQTAEEIGPSLRRELRENHFGERMAAALEPRGYRS